MCKGNTRVSVKCDCDWCTFFKTGPCGPGTLSWFQALCSFRNILSTNTNVGTFEWIYFQEWMSILSCSMYCSVIKLIGMCGRSLFDEHLSDAELSVWELRKICYNFIKKILYFSVETCMYIDVTKFTFLLNFYPFVSVSLTMLHVTVMEFTLSIIYTVSLFYRLSFLQCVLSVFSYHQF